MTDKAYIVANEEQECEVLDKLEREGFVWVAGGEKPTKWLPSKKLNNKFPYAITADKYVSWRLSSELENYEIVFDGRKEERMSERYIVSQEFMNELEEWKDNRVVVTFVNGADISHLPLTVNDWWFDNLPYKEYNNRLIAILRWLNGEDVFEVESKKWVVRSKGTDTGNDHVYIAIINIFGVKTVKTFYDIDNATKFDTKEEAESWANAHQEVVQVEVKE